MPADRRAPRSGLTLGAVLRMAFVALLLSMQLPVCARATVPERPDTFAYVVDLAGVLTAQEEADITACGEMLSARTGATMVLLTVDSLDGMAARDYAFDVLNGWGIGDASRDDGVLLLLAVADREVAVEPGSGLDSTLTVAVTDDLLDQVVDDLAADRFGEGMTRLYDLTSQCLIESGLRAVSLDETVDFDSLYTKCIAWLTAGCLGVRLLWSVLF